MENMVAECLQLAKLSEEAEKLLHSSTFRKVLSNKRLTVHEKQSILCTTAKIECIKARFDIMTRRKSGGGLQVENKKIIDRVRWIDMDKAFNNRMRAAVIANLAHIDLIKFLQDVAILFSRKMKSILLTNANDKTFKILKNFRNVTLVGHYILLKTYRLT
ncbi:hypothetical protein TSAR_005784 [Trichomalopsis sarcophagae]|uniref:Uncharacterized protein n=1 Tax=Trichomalopsis sarcophagae TaxID=543379 RepID=A0A232EEI0_9HYME|nr:hypothetical protein TSAR_005784 [Trichomalopsis sarcophagae]